MERKSIIVLVLPILLMGCFAHATNLYFSCSDGTIRKFDSSGNGSIFASGLDKPFGLAFDDSGNLYAAINNWGVYGYYSGTIEKFDSSGNQSTFASGLRFPSGLAFRNGYFYMVNSLDDPGQIFKFDLNGNKSFFAEAPDGTSIGAIDLAIDSNGYVYMSDIMGNIFKFDSSGNGSTFASGLDSLYGLAFDNSDNLYAASCGDGTILKFDSIGNSTIFASGLSSPHGLTFDNSGNLYVADGGTILEFDSSGNSTIFASGLSGFGFIAIPEPTTLLLLGIGSGLILRRKHI